jgi:hypothetical protein
MWGLMCASPVTEAEFSNPANIDKLRRLLGRLALVKQLIGAEKLSLAGVLPTFLSSLGESRSAGPDYTPEAVRQAIYQVRQKHFGNSPHEIVLLGGAGRIGRDVRQLLVGDGLTSQVIDTATEGCFDLSSTAGTPVLLVDVSRRGVIDGYIDRLPKGSVVLNEVFPEPSRETRVKLRSQGIAAIHIAGVKAAVFPSLPLGYNRALPCCAIHAPRSTELVLVQLV